MIYSITVYTNLHHIYWTTFILPKCIQNIIFQNKCTSESKKVDFINICRTLLKRLKYIDTYV